MRAVYTSWEKNRTHLVKSVIEGIQVVRGSHMIRSQHGGMNSSALSLDLLRMLDSVGSQYTKPTLLGK